MPRFQRVYIEISNICNLRCHFCPEVDRAKKVMDLSLFQNTISQLKGLTKEVTFHLMGEPLTHPQFTEFVDHCEQVGMPINLTTNGTLLKNKERAEKLLSPALRQVNFSLQSFAANFPQKNPADYLRQIFNWTKNALIQRPDLYINYRLWNIGSEEEKCIGNAEYVQAIEAFFGCTLPAVVDVKFAKSRRVSGRLYLHFDSRFEWPQINAPVRSSVGHCYALKNHIGIHADGSVVPCCLDKEANIVLGNMKDGLLSVLQSPRAMRMRLGFDRFQLCEGLCQRCGFISRFDKKVRHRDTAVQRTDSIRMVTL